MSNWIPYGHQRIEEDDIQAVSEVLRSDWLTTGPEVEKFERALADTCGARYAIVLNSGTAALHAAYFAAGVGPGDEVITTPLTFAATANAALYLGARVVFADIEPGTGNISAAEVEAKLSSRTKVVAPVDYAGHPADLDNILASAHSAGAVVVEDACHALGGRYQGRPIGSIADLTVFSFHPVKHITTGEGGAVLTNNPEYAEQIRSFRTHGITKQKQSVDENGPWFYEMRELGYNYRLPDILCALGRSQLSKLHSFISRRKAIAEKYFELLSDTPGLILPTVHAEADPAWHLFVVRTKNEKMRRPLVETLRAAGIGVQVHYIPVYWHPFYQENRDLWDGNCSQAERFYRSCISLPIYPGLDDPDVEFVANTIKGFFEDDSWSIERG